MIKEHICKHCGQAFDKGTQLGAHVLSCKLNPKNIYYKSKRINSIKNKNYKNDYELICPICGKTYILNLTLNDFKSKKYRKTCSKTCANKLAILNCDNNKRKNKISNSVKSYNKNKNINKKIFTCEYCGKLYSKSKDWKSNKYCCEDCLKINKHNKLSQAAIKNKLGGLNSNTTHKNYKRGYYKGIWCDSSWELAFVVYHLDNNIKIERNYNYKEYTFNNNIYKFYPDFIVDGKLYEIKGFITPKNKAKIEQINDVKFIFRNDIKFYLNYAIEKYGSNFCDILYEK